MHYQKILTFIISSFILSSGSCAALPDDYEWLQNQLLSAQAGDVIQLPARTLHLSRSLSLMQNRVQLIGDPVKTRLSFKQQHSGAEGLLVKGNGIGLRGFQIQDSAGDGLKVMDSENLLIEQVSVSWTGGPKATNGGYGIYPVRSKKVTVRRCTVNGASEAGIYLGQSVDGRLQHNNVSGNLVGIEVENSQQVLIEHNTSDNNSIGILVSHIPGLPLIGSDILISHNSISNNQLADFSRQPNLLAHGHSGTGIMVSAVKGVFISANKFSQHPISHILINNHISTGLVLYDETFDALPQAIMIDNNQFEASTSIGINKVFGYTLNQPADLIWDGQSQTYGYAWIEPSLASWCLVSASANLVYQNLQQPKAAIPRCQALAHSALQRLPLVAKALPNKLKYSR